MPTTPAPTIATALLAALLMASALGAAPAGAAPPDPTSETSQHGPPRIPPPVALPSIKPGVGAVHEGTGGTTVGQIPITLSAPSRSTITVDWATLELPPQLGVAVPGEDFAIASGTVTFAPGETVQHVDVTVFGDAIAEPPLFYGEWGLVQFSNPQNASLDTSSWAGAGVLIILDDD